MKNIYENGRYSESNPDWHVADSPWKAKQILRMLEKHGLKPQTVVEVGCGVGEILNQLHGMLPTQVEFTGYERAGPKKLDRSLGGISRVDYAASVMVSC